MVVPSGIMTTFITPKKRLVHAGLAWLLAPLAVLAVSGLVVWFSDANKDLFRFVNRWSLYTGPNYWAILTIFGDGVVSFAILLPWIRKRPQIIWAVFIAAICFSIVGVVAKEFIDYPRPPKVLEEGSFFVIGPDYKHHSFPSGHAATIAGVASVWLFSIRRKWVRPVVLFFGLLIAASRVVVGIHWPLDVICGAFNGWLFGWVGLKIAERTSWGYSRVGMKIFGALLLICCIVMMFPYSDFEIIIWEQRTLAAVLFLVGLHEYVGLWKRQQGEEHRNY